MTDFGTVPVLARRRFIVLATVDANVDGPAQGFVKGEPAVIGTTAREARTVSSSHEVLVVERSRLRDNRWRFGRGDEPHSAWGLIERNEIGGIVVAKLQEQIADWRDDSVTALCLVSRHPDEPRMEYDLSWRPAESPLYKTNAIARESAPEHRETLDERASRLRGGSQT